MTIVSVTWTANGFSGTFIPAYTSKIQDAVDLLSPTDGYELRFVDLNAYDVIESGDPPWQK